MKKPNRSVSGRGGCPEINNNFIAEVILVSIYRGHREVCKEFDITERTYRTYRAKFLANPEIQDLVRQKRQAFDARWVEQLTPALCRAIAKIDEVTEAIAQDPIMRKNPAALTALTSAAEVLAKILFNGKVVDARLAQYHGPAPRLLGSTVDTEDGAALLPN